MFSSNTTKYPPKPSSLPSHTIPQSVIKRRDKNLEFSPGFRGKKKLFGFVVRDNKSSVYLP